MGGWETVMGYVTHQNKTIQSEVEETNKKYEESQGKHWRVNQT